MNTLYRAMILTAVMAAGSVFSMFSQNEKPDTILHITTPSKVILTETPSGSTLQVRSIDGDDRVIATVVTDYPDDSSVRTNSSEEWFGEWWSERNILGSGHAGNSHWGMSVDGLCIGLDKAVGQTPEGGMQWSKSFEISWMSILNVYYRFSRSSVSLGLGLDWRNYKITTSDKSLVANEAGGIEWSRYPEGVSGRFSRLKIFSLQLPLLYSYKIPKSSLGIKIGPIFNFNTYASLKSVWDDEDGNRMEYFTKEIDPKRFTVDFFASISLCRTVGLYVRYSPMKVMDSPHTINFRPLSVGLGFGI